MNEDLARWLDDIAYNAQPKFDNDFVIIVTGDRTVRIGKSVMGMTVCAYLSSRIKQMGANPNPFSIKHIFFDNKDMINFALKNNEHKCNIYLYDEGSEGLSVNKSFTAIQKDLLQFFDECGQLNNIYVIVAPDFFNVKEQMAVARSEYLINVYRKDEIVNTNTFGEGNRDFIHFKKGQFEFFRRKAKEILFDNFARTRRKSYHSIKCTCYGSFTNQYVVDEAEYRKLKADSLKRFSFKKEENLYTKRYAIFRDKIIFDLKNEQPDLTTDEISKYIFNHYKITLDRSTISKLLRENTFGFELKICGKAIKSEDNQSNTPTGDVL